MTKSEISSKIDEIVEFSGCERYIDTPVKRYSSGMRVRLAFAVAAHLEPDILVIDEVLAVGDAEFQKKAIGKMQDISKGDGRTVLFVSHNMAAVKSLCTRAIVLEYGEVVFEGQTDEAVSFYLKGGKAGSRNIKKFVNEFNREYFKLSEVSIHPKGNYDTEILNEHDAINLYTEIYIKKKPENFHITYVLNNENGDTLFTMSHIGDNKYLEIGRNFLTCEFPKGFLNVGDYYLSFYIIENKKKAHFIEKDILSFRVDFGERSLGSWMQKEPGFIRPKFNWQIENES